MKQKVLSGAAKRKKNKEQKEIILKSNKKIFLNWINLNKVSIIRNISIL